MIVEWDMEALKQICRDEPITAYMEGIAHDMVTDIRDESARTRDNSPRRVRPSSINAGQGYTHYDEEVWVTKSIKDGMSVVYVNAARHVMVMEFGWTNWQTGIKYPGRYYMTKALMRQRVS